MEGEEGTGCEEAPDAMCLRDHGGRDTGDDQLQAWDSGRARHVREAFLRDLYERED